MQINIVKSLQLQCCSRPALARPTPVLTHTSPESNKQNPQQQITHMSECVSRSARATRWHNCAPPLPRLCCCEARSQLQEIPPALPKWQEGDYAPCRDSAGQLLTLSCKPYLTAHACRQPSAQRHAFTGWPYASRRVSYSGAHATAQIASLVSTYASK